MAIPTDSYGHIDPVTLHTNPMDHPTPLRPGWAEARLREYPGLWEFLEEKQKREEEKENLR